MTKSLILDCDGVLLNWRDSFNHWLVQNEFILDHQAWRTHLYGFDDAFLPPYRNVAELGRKLIRIYNESHHVGHLPPIDGARQAVRRFHDAGYHIHVITAFSSNYQSMKLREKNLKDLFGDVFQEIAAIEVGGHKGDWLKKQNPNSVYVEDVARHLDEAVEAGLDDENCYLVRHDYNGTAPDKPDKYYRGTWKSITDRELGEE